MMPTCKTKMDLSDLPAEMVELVASYLSWNDIDACSRACSLWDKALNIDRIWGRFCSYEPKYFDKQSKMVPYTTDNSGNFKYVCKTKQTFYNEICVKNNVLNGKYHVSKIECGELYCDNVFDVVDSAGNHWLFISCMKGCTSPFQQEHKFQVWNLNKEPILHRLEPSPIGVVNRLLDTYMSLKEGKFFFLAHDVALIYEFAFPIYDFKFVQCLSLNVGQTLCTSAAIVLDSLLLTFSYLDSSPNITERPSYHVWNKEGVLVKHETFPITEPLNHPCHPVLQIKSNNTDTVVVVSSCNIKGVMNHEHEESYSMRVFYIPCLSYSKFLVRKSRIPFFNIHKNVIVCLTERFSVVGSCSIYYLEKGEIRYETSIDMKRDSCYLELVPGEKELAVTQEGVVSIFDIASKREISKIKVPDKQLECKVVNDTLILVYDKIRSKHGVWNFRTRQCLYDFHFSTSLGIEKNYMIFTFISNCVFPPKMIAYMNPQYSYPRDNKNTEIYIFSFW